MTTATDWVLRAMDDETLDAVAERLFGESEAGDRLATEAYYAATAEQCRRAEAEVEALRYEARKAGL